MVETAKLVAAERGVAYEELEELVEENAAGCSAGDGVVRLGQNFLADPNLLEAIVREAELGPEDVVLEVGAGEGVLTAALARAAGHVHSVELDERLREGLELLAAEHAGVELYFGDAMALELGAFAPPPTAIVANLPYAIATPLILRTITELPG